ncbi:fused response regulator/phosphatase [Saccharothrix yanglingensis]|uniref:Response regulator receiver protein n=1 Tax=Saccharothrix yanglingensis TaxID=659496 RepID=A0ABU0WVW9_9PSEU|nr:fused response regulator/phosphatase [Saccharothrix yanglingensis]MDQ2584002.1 response regulator receiver protein [Saccharothrix yanglingensis]
MTPPAEGARILVVDDTVTSRYVRVSWLRRGGHHVSEAVTGGEALAKLGEHEFDLVLLDVDLPDMSGYDVAERIKSDPRTAAVPVVHVSAAFRETEDRITGLNRGADAYLTEPIEPRELLATVEAALRYYRARALAERLADRLAKLTSATLRINSTTTFHALAEAAAEGAASVAGTPATVLLSPPGGPLLVGSTGAAVRSEPASLLDGMPAHTSTVLDPPWEPGVPASVVVARGNPRSAPIRVAVPPGAVATEEDRNLVLQLAQTTALAAEGLRAYAEEHTLALTLQNSLLPRRLPTLPALPMTARYEPASAHAEIGGDFYEVTELGDRLLIAIGDVTGHSLAAALVMGEVRHALRAYAVHETDPVEILRRIDAMIGKFHGVRGLTTMCLMVVDPAEETVLVANGGHIPPLVADASGTRYLDVRGPLLGIGLARPPATEFALPVGSVVLLTTDGLVEHSGADLDEGMERLRTAVAHDDDMDVLCDRLLADFGQDKKDDIALFAFRRDRLVPKVTPSGS